MTCHSLSVSFLSNPVRTDLIIWVGVGACLRKGQSQGNPRWEGQAGERSFAMSCNTQGSWPYLPWSVTCLLVLGKWILSCSLAFPAWLTLSLVQSTAARGEPGRSCAWGRDEFCISTTVIHQVQSMVWVTSQVRLHTIHQSGSGL